MEVLRLLHRQALLKLSKPVEDDIDLGFRIGLRFREHYNEVLAVRRDVIGTWTGIEDSLNRESYRFSGHETRLSLNIHLHDLIGETQVKQLLSIGGP